MAKAASKSQPESILRRHESTLLACAQARLPGILRIAAILAVGMLAMASPSFAQHGGGGGGHAGGGGGGHSGGGGHFAGRSGGSGGHLSSGKGHSAGGVSGSHATTAGPSGVSANLEGAAGKPRETGIGGAFRRFFGFSHSSSTPNAVRDASATSTSASLVNRATAQASLPPAFSRLRLNASTTTALSDNAASRSEGAAVLSARPAITASPRPIGPSPRRFFPVGVGFFGGFGPAFGFGFGAPFFGFNCFYFNCFGFNSFGYGYGPFGYGPFGYNYFGSNYLGYDNFGSYPISGRYNAQAQATMLLYLTDGSAFEVTDYWVDGDTLRYIDQEGKKGNALVNDVDVQRTTDANARVGFQFNLDRTQRGTPLDRVEPPASQPDEPQSPQK